jgi:hypothetical protein
MLKRKLLLGALVASSLGIIPLQASAGFRLSPHTPPPPPREEVIPAPRHGYVWAPGYWDHAHGRYHWVRGHWIRERRGMYWHPDRWENRDGHWVLERGGWHRERWERERLAERRDRDGDGVPNRFDRAPDNPNFR